jgi:CheY-like chemotaxis protein
VPPFVGVRGRPVLLRARGRVAWLTLRRLLVRLDDVLLRHSYCAIDGAQFRLVVRRHGALAAAKFYAHRRDIGGDIPGHRIVVVGSHPELLDALVDLIIEEPDLHLVAATRSATEAIELARLSTPDVLLVDVDATDISAERIAREVNLYSSRTRLIALSSYHDAASVRRTLDAGFHHHVSKVSGIADLLVVLLEDHVCVA